jgi:hypothetical protein
MKKYLFLMIMAISNFCVSGCGSEFVGGAAAGSAAVAGGSAYLNAVKAGLDEKEAVLIQQRETALNDLATSTDDLEKTALQNKIAVLEKQMNDVQGQKQIVAVGNQAMGTNWTDPGAVGSLVGTGVAAFMAWYFANRGGKVAKKYDAIKAGVNKTLAETGMTDSKVLYNNIGEERAKAGLS